MIAPPSPIAVVDTDVFSALYIDPDRAAKRGHPVETWTSLLTGVRVLIAFQTRAEVITGFTIGSWSQRRASAARARLDSMPTIPADHEVIEAYAF